MSANQSPVNEAAGRGPTVSGIEKARPGRLMTEET